MTKVIKALHQKPFLDLPTGLTSQQSGDRISPLAGGTYNKYSTIDSLRGFRSPCALSVLNSVRDAVSFYSQGPCYYSVVGCLTIGGFVPPQLDLFSTQHYFLTLSSRYVPGVTQIRFNELQFLWIINFFSWLLTPESWLIHLWDHWNRLFW